MSNAASEEKSSARGDEKSSTSVPDPWTLLVHLDQMIARFYWPSSLLLSRHWTILDL